MKSSGRHIEVTLPVEHVETASFTIRALCMKLELITGKPVFNQDYAVKACGGSTPEQDVAMLDRYAQSARDAWRVAHP